MLLLLFTSPEPVPPFTVFPAPAPYKPIFMEIFRGSIFLSFFSSTIPSSAAFSERRPFRISRSDILCFFVPLCFHFLTVISYLLPFVILLRLQVSLLDNQSRNEIIVPGAYKCKNRLYSDCRLHDWQDNTVESTEFSGAVNSGCFYQ